MLHPVAILQIIYKRKLYFSPPVLINAYGNILYNVILSVMSINMMTVWWHNRGISSAVRTKTQMKESVSVCSINNSAFLRLSKMWLQKLYLGGHWNHMSSRRLSKMWLQNLYLSGLWNHMRSKRLSKMWLQKLYLSGLWNHVRSRRSFLNNKTKWYIC